MVVIKEKRYFLFSTENMKMLHLFFTQKNQSQKSSFLETKKLYCSHTIFLKILLKLSIFKNKNIVY